MPLYLHHRYAVEAAVSVARRAGLHLRDARRRPDAGAVDAGRVQQDALDALMSTLKLNELALSPSLLDRIPPRPSGSRPDARAVSALRRAASSIRSRRPIVATDMIVGFLLTHDRAARLVAQHAVDPRCPGLKTSSTGWSRPCSARPRRHLRSRNQTRHRARGRRSPDRPGRHRADVAGARDRHATAEGDPGPPGDDRRRFGAPLAARERHSAVPDRPSIPARDYAQPATPPGAPIGDMGMDFLKLSDFGMCISR